MSEPTYSATTERLYARLPESYRNLDIQQNWELKKFISSIADQLGDIDALIQRIEYIPENERFAYYSALNQYNTYQRPPGIEDPAYGWSPMGETSDLIDGRTANLEWLDYIGMLTGAQVRPLETEDEKRDAIIRGYLGLTAGSRQAVEDAVKRVLTGTKYARVYPQRDGAGGNPLSPGTQWDVLIVTRASETPIGIDLAAEVTNKGAKPAGVILHHIPYNIVWLVIETSFDTWAKIEATLTWGNFETANADDLPLP